MSTSIQGNNLKSNKPDTTTVSYEVPIGMIAETTIKKAKSKPSFMLVGNGIGSTSKGTHSMDYTETLLGLSKAGRDMFGNLFKNRLDEEDASGFPVPFKKRNICYLDRKGMTEREVKNLTKGYKELADKDVVVRIKRGWYVINPRLIISGDHWEEEEVLFTNAKEGKKLPSKYTWLTRVRGV